jgi:hypothetical protein
MRLRRRRITGWAESENYPPFCMRVEASINCTACS